MRSRWVRSISDDPIAYARHRLCVASNFLGWDTPTVHFPYQAPFPTAAVEAIDTNWRYGQPLEAVERTPLNIDLYWFFDAEAHGPMFRLYLYILAALVITGALLVLRALRPIHVALLASILLALARVAILPATDFRYGLWIVAGTLVLAFVALDDVVHEKRRRPE